MLVLRRGWSEAGGVIAEHLVRQTLHLLQVCRDVQREHSPGDGAVGIPSNERRGRQGVVSGMFFLR
jgi:hypothetical protein